MTLLRAAIDEEAYGLCDISDPAAGEHPAWCSDDSEFQNGV